MIKLTNLQKIYRTKEIETVALDDPRLSNVWGKEIYRLSLNAGKMVKSGTYTFTIKQNNK